MAGSIGFAQAARARAGRVTVGRDDHRRPRASGSQRESAARYSFLLSVPAVVLSGLFELQRTSATAAVYGVFPPRSLATILAFVVGYWSIAFLLRFLATHTLKAFVAYRVVVGSARVGAGRGRNDQLAHDAERAADERVDPAEVGVRPERADSSASSRHAPGHVGGARPVPSSPESNAHRIGQRVGDARGPIARRRGGGDRVPDRLLL